MTESTDAIKAARPPYTWVLMEAEAGELGLESGLQRPRPETFPAQRRALITFSQGYC